MSYPNKPANPDYPITELIKDRWSPRCFSDQPISVSDMNSMLEAGRWAPSSNNFQPWRIVWAVKGQSEYEKMYELLDDFNKTWAVNATAFVLGAYQIYMPNQGLKENFHALYDLGSFMTMFSLQAQSMGIAVHQMAGFNFKKANIDFNFGPEYHVAISAALGYFGGDPKVLPENLIEAETTPNRFRNPQSQFAFNGEYEGE